MKYYLALLTVPVLLGIGTVPWWIALPVMALVVLVAEYCRRKAGQHGSCQPDCAVCATEKAIQRGR